MDSRNQKMKQAVGSSSQPKKSRARQTRQTGSPQPISVPNNPFFSTSGSPQTQSAPYYPQMPSPQSPYYPQMPYGFVQPPPQPIHPSQFNMQAVRDFEPFENYRDTNTVDDDDDDDDVDVVRETQLPVDVDDDEPRDETQRASKRAPREVWTPAQEVALAQAWVQISTCNKVGNEQSSEGFWSRVHKHFVKEVGQTTRTHHGLTMKWSNMNKDMSHFNGLFHQSTRLQQSGCDRIDVMANAMADFKVKNKKAFTHLDAWRVVKDQEKWLEQPCVQDWLPESHSDKRRKSSESGNYESVSGNDNYNTVLPNLNEDPNPPCDKKGKKKASSSLQSIAEDISERCDSYTSQKMEMAKARETMAKDLMQEQLASIKERNFREDLRFFSEPHDNALNETIRQIIVNKKNSIADCSFHIIAYEKTFFSHFVGDVGMIIAKY